MTRPAGSDDLVLVAGDARAVVSPGNGGRLASVVVAGHELLVNEGEAHPMQWGCYPMAPWAGRVRHGRFAFRGRTYQLPLGMPPHAIHGTAYDRPWQVLDARTIAIDLGGDGRWPFGGRVTQRFALDEDGLAVSMMLEASQAMPAMLGWHPWFRRVLAPGAAPVRLAFAAAEMLVRDGEGMPTGERVRPPRGPWDDAFTGVRDDPMLEWPGRLRLGIASTCDWWVVYSEPEHAVCVEPQSGPPDAFNGEPEVLEPGASMTHEMRWRWTRL